MIKQFKYSLLTKRGFLLSLVRSHALSGAASTPWPLPPQGSHVSSSGPGTLGRQAEPHPTGEGGQYKTTFQVRLGEE